MAWNIQDSDDMTMMNGSAMSSPKNGGTTTRARNTSVLEKLRLRSKTTIERDHQRQPSDFGPLAQGELFGLSISLRIPFTQTGAGKSGAMRVLYIIRCTMAPPENAPSNTPAKSWETAKRYSEFVTLDKAIRDVLIKGFHSVESSFGLAMLPPRHILTSDFDEAIIAERRQGFVQYLQSALTASFFYEDVQTILATFLDCPGAAKNGKLLRQNDSNETEDGKAPDKGTAVLTHTIAGDAQHGFLHRHAGPGQIHVKPYKLVFCVLNFKEGVFRWYKPSHPVLLGEYTVKGVYGKAYALEPKQFGMPATGYGFTVWTPNWELIMYAETGEDRVHWINSFKILLSSAAPHGVVDLPVRSPRPETQSIDIEGSDLNLGSLIYSQESRRLSSAMSDVRSASLSDAGLGSRKASKTGSILEENANGKITSGRNNSMLESLPEIQRSKSGNGVNTVESLEDIDAGEAMLPLSSVIVAGAPPPHASVLHSTTREVIQVAASRRSRTASGESVSKLAEAVVASAMASARASLTGAEPSDHVSARDIPTSPLATPPRSPARNQLGSPSKERQRNGSLAQEVRGNGLKTADRDNNGAFDHPDVIDARRASSTASNSPSGYMRKKSQPAKGGKILVDKQNANQEEKDKSSISRTVITDLPRFPSNISIMTEMRGRDNSSVRPPSTDPEEALSPPPPPPSSGPSGLRSSSSWKTLPPPRFPSNLRLTSSGETSVASPQRRTRKPSRTRAHPFRLFMAVASSTGRSLDVLEDDALSGELFSRAMVRLKVDSLPTRNPHVLLGLLATPDPWKGRAIGLMSAHQFSSCLENIYFDVHSLRKSAIFRPKPNDWIVTSVARAGATPVLFALDSIRNGRLVRLEDLASRVPWLEGKELNHDSFKVPVTPVDTARSNRLLKTTLPVRYCLGIAGGHHVTSSMAKVVVVLRDPLDLRLSWFRHCRRVYKKCCKKGLNFDDKFALADFSQVPVPSCNPTFSAAMSPNETYEVYLREVLQVYDSGRAAQHLHIVFYEELLADCENTVRKLVNFIDPTTDEQLIRDIVDALQESQDFPGSANEETGQLRTGSTGHGSKLFSRHEVELIDSDWDRIVKAHFPHFDQYSAVFESISESPYPYPRIKPFDEDLLKARKSSGLNALSLSGGGRRSLLDLSITKFVQKRIGSSQSNTEPFRTNDKVPQHGHIRLDPDDSELDE